MRHDKAIVTPSGDDSVQLRAMVAATRVLRRSIDELAQRMVNALVLEVPSYATLPREELATDVLAICRLNLRAFIASLDPHAGDDVLDPAVLRRSAADRAEEGVPMTDVLSAYHLGVQVCLEFLSQRMGDGLLPATLRVSRHAIDYLARAMVIVAEGYMQQRQLTLGDDVSDRLELGTALVEGHSPGRITELAGAAGIELPSQYLVLAPVLPTREALGGRGCVSQPGHPEANSRHHPKSAADSDVESAESVSGRAITARRLRPVRAALLSTFGDGGLWVPAHPLILVPLSATYSVADAKAAVEHIISTLGIPIIVGMSTGRVVASDVSVAASIARDVRDLADRTYRPPGSYEIGDLALEYQLSRSGPARDALSALIAPLDDEPRLASTLNTYIAHGLSRQRAARPLQVHPNTVDNRLRRIAELTGLDPTDPRDITHLHAALLARAR